jgi:hypothetical protein
VCHGRLLFFSAGKSLENAFIFNGGLHFYKENLKENEKYIILLQLCIQNLEDKNSK